MKNDFFFIILFLEIKKYKVLFILKKEKLGLDYDPNFH